MKRLSTQRKKVLYTTIFATLLMAGISAYSSILSQQASIDGCKQHEMDVAVSIIQSSLQSEMNNAASKASVVAHLPSIIDAFRAGNREQILARLLPAFLIQRDRYGVNEGQFHTAPATSFLRIYTPEAGHGEDLSSFREMVVNTNKEHAPKKGIEVGRAGISIRGVDLLKDAEGYIGSFEVGMSFMTVLDYLKKNTGFEGGAFVDNELVSRVATLLPPPDAERIVAGLRNVEATDWNVLKAIVTPELLASGSGVKTVLKTVAGSDYGIVIIPLQDYKGVGIGSIVAVKKFDVFQKESSAAVVRAISFALLQVLVIAGIVLVMINVMFVRSASVQESSK